MPFVQAVVPRTVYLTFLEKERHLIHRHERTGRPLGEGVFIKNVQQVFGRSLRPQKPGPKRRGGWVLSLLAPEFLSNLGHNVPLFPLPALTSKLQGMPPGVIIEI